MSLFRRSIYTLFLAFLLVVLPKAVLANDFAVKRMIVKPTQILVGEEVEVIIEFNVDLVQVPWPYKVFPEGLEDYNYQFEDFEVISIDLPIVRVSGPADGNPPKINNPWNYVIKGKFLKTGRKRLYFTFNDKKRTEEGTWKNNTIRDYFEVESPYDIAVESINITPQSPVIGKDSKIVVKVKNNSKKDLTSGFGTKYTFDNFSLTKSQKPLINNLHPFPKASTTEFIYYGKFKKPIKTSLKFEVDMIDAFEEFNEENNSKEKEIEVFSKSQVDLAIDSIEYGERGAVVNNESDIVVTWKNTGVTSIVDGAGFRVMGDNYNFENFLLSNIECDDYPTLKKPLEKGAKYKCTFTGRYKKSGLAKIEFKVDARDELLESDEDNNATTTEKFVHISQEQADAFEIIHYEMQHLSASSTMFIIETSRETDAKVIIRRGHSANFEEVFTDGKKTKTHKVKVSPLVTMEKYFYELVLTNYEAERKTKPIEFRTKVDSHFDLLNLKASINQGEKTATITWDTGFRTEPSIEYRLKKDKKFLKKTNIEEGLSHEFVLTSLKDGVYEYLVSSKTDSGKIVKSSLETFEIGGPAESSQIEKVGKEGGNSKKQEQSESEVKKEANNLKISNEKLYNNLKGKIILKVESKGEAFYVNPGNQTMHFLGRPKDAFNVMRAQGLGISNTNLYKIPLGFASLSGEDKDGDGLSSDFEATIGTDDNKVDTDGDGFSDKDEVVSGYNPRGGAKQKIDKNFSDKQKGKIFLQVEGRGEAWYVSPNDGKRYFLGRPNDAFFVMRKLGLGISNNNFDQLD